MRAGTLQVSQRVGVEAGSSGGWNIDEEEWNSGRRAARVATWRYRGMGGWTAGVQRWRYAGSAGGGLQACRDNNGIDAWRSGVRVAGVRTIEVWSAGGVPMWKHRHTKVLEVRCRHSI